ncbi:unnamed protein product [Ectocarpus fasciculatus]
MAQYPHAPPAAEPPAEDESSRSKVFPVHGNTTNFNINSLLYNNILQSDYFKALYQLRTYHETIDEVYNSVRHVGPWQTGTTRTPSTASCLLLKFMLMKLTHKQLRGLLETSDSPYVRSMGLLFLRYCCPPKDLWSYFEPFLEDDEEFAPSPDEDLKMTMGEFCIKLLTDMQYFGTTLPRIPVPIERKIKVMLLLLQERQRRRRENARLQDLGKFSKGSKVQAIYGDEANEPAWYEAVIDSKASTDDFYYVTFPEYGNSELVDLGDMRIVEEKSTRRSAERSSRRSSSRERDRHRHSRSRSRSRDRRRSRSRSSDRRGGSSREGVSGQRDLMAEVLQKERAASESVGSKYAVRPASYKGSLSLKQERFTVRKRSRSRSPPRGSNRDRRPSGRDRRSPSPPSQASVQKSREVSREQQEKMKRILDRYGDASAK